MLTFITFIKVHEVLIFNEGAIFGRNQFGGGEGRGRICLEEFCVCKVFYWFSIDFQTFFTLCSRTLPQLLKDCTLLFKLSFSGICSKN